MAKHLRLDALMVEEHRSQQGYLLPGRTALQNEIFHKLSLTHWDAPRGGVECD